MGLDNPEATANMVERGRMRNRQLPETPGDAIVKIVMRFYTEDMIMRGVEN